MVPPLQPLAERNLFQMMVLWKPEGGSPVEGKPYCKATRVCCKRVSHLNPTLKSCKHPTLTVTNATSSLPKGIYSKIGQNRQLVCIAQSRDKAFMGTQGLLSVTSTAGPGTGRVLGCFVSPCIQGHPGQIPIFRSNLKCLALSGAQQGNEQ